MFYLIFALNYLLLAPMHIGQIAEFHYSLDGDEVKMRFMIDQDEIKHFEFDNDCDFENLIALCTANYINENSTLVINHEALMFELESAHTDSGHLVVIQTAKFKSREVDHIYIKNDCFYSIDHHYRNRVVLDIDEFSGSYLLTNHKTEIWLE